MSLMIVEDGYPPLDLGRNNQGELVLRDSGYDSLFESAEDFHDWFYATFHEDISQDQLELVERWLGLDE